MTAPSRSTSAARTPGGDSRTRKIRAIMAACNRLGLDEDARRDRIEQVSGQRSLSRLTDGQFSALVSFAYNVGLGAFARSSVLRAVNARDFDAVPRRLALWVKAGGRRLPGLVKRRAAEGAMFMAAADEEPASDNAPSMPAPRAPEPVQGKPMRESTTGWAAVLSALAGLFSAIGAVFRDIAEQAGGTIALGIAIAVILLATGWILRERYLKSAHDGV